MMMFLPQTAVLQLGARNHYLTASVLHNHGLLYRLYTDAYAKENSWQLRLARCLASINPALKRTLRSRCGSLPSKKVNAAWSVTLMAKCLAQMPRPFSSPASRDARVAQALTSYAIRNGLEEASMVYGYSGASSDLFRYARQKGIRTVLDQASATVATSTRIMHEEFSAASDWGSFNRPDMTKYAESERKELALADLILAPSEFVHESLLAVGVPDQKIKVVPYGFNISGLSRHPTKRRNGPLKVLFLGNVNLQKGIRHFLSATKLVDPVKFRFRVVGPIHIESGQVDTFRPMVEFTGHVPRNEVSKHYEWADIFVMPTLCDGFGLVQLEAASFGLPIIVTENCGYIVRDGIDGYVVEPGNAEVIAERMQLLESDAGLLEKFSREIIQRVNDYSVDNYSQQLFSAIGEHA